jgi:LAO/AO transport system kinase
MSDGADLAARLRDGDLAAAPAVLNLVETRGRRDEVAALLHGVAPAQLGEEARAHVVGITGPPGAGKSTLLSELVRTWRARGKTVAVLAVDPSSKRSGGALLGDRARIEYDPSDKGIFIRSTAAGGRLGGLAPGTRAAAQALAAAFDVVVIETVGVGQSETEVAEVADTVAVIVQPGSGDALQFLKSGIMEVPDVLVSSLPPAQGVEELADALDAHRAGLDLAERRLAARRANALADFAAEHGEAGLRALGGRRAAERLLAEQDPGADVAALADVLESAAR